MTAVNLTTSATGSDSRLWGGVNVDGGSRFTANGLDCQEAVKVWSETYPNPNMNSTVTIDGYVTVYGVDGEKVHFTTKDVAEANDAVKAKVGDNYYGTLQAAINAAGNGGDVVTLVNDTAENVVIGSDKNITLDLNGCTLKGSTVNADYNGTWKYKDVTVGKGTVTNFGTMTIKDSSGATDENSMGKIVGMNAVTNTSTGATSGKIALVNMNGATCTIESGMITRETYLDEKDYGQMDWHTSNYTVQNMGKMYIRGGRIVNDSNYSSLVVNFNNLGSSSKNIIYLGELQDVYMEVSGGVLEQNTYSALKNDPNATLVIKGDAQITNGNNYVSQFYGTATIEGGSINGGQLWVCSYEAQRTGDDSVTSFPTNATISGGNVDVSAVYVINGYTIPNPTTDIKATLAITNGSINCSTWYELIMSADGKNFNVSNNKNRAEIVISGGTFDKDISKYVADGYVATNQDSTWTVELDTSSNYWVATIEETGVLYHTLQDAVDAATSGQTVTLLTDASENIVIGAEQDIVLNIPENVTLSNSGKSHTVMVDYGGKLTVVGSGVLTNANQKAALFNRGTVILAGAEVNCTGPETGDRWYIIANHGDMTIQEGAKVIAETHQASMIWNGYHNYSGTTLTGTANDGYIEGKNHAFPKLTITGGIVKCLDNTAIKNEDGGILEISGNPEITGGKNFAFFNCHVANVSGGTFNGPIANYSSATYKSASGEELNSGALTITGGNFNNAHGHNFQMYGAEPIHGEKIQISGGTFGGCDWSLGKDCVADGCMNADSYDSAATTECVTSLKTTSPAIIRTALGLWFPTTLRVQEPTTT